MNGTEEIDALLAKAVDDELNEAERLHLGALLRDDPACQDAYLDYMLLDSLLHWEKPAFRASQDEECGPDFQSGPSAGRVGNPAHLPMRRRFSARPIIRWALAACLLLAVGTGVFVMTRPDAIDPVEPNPPLVDRLVEWNLTITSTATAEERQERYRVEADAFAAELAKTNLPEEERPLALALLDNARTLAANDGPLENAEQLDKMSEVVLNWIGDNPKADPKRTKVMEQNYLRLVERSLGQLKHARSAAKSDEAQQKRLERVNERIAARAAARAAKEAAKEAAKTAPPKKKKSR